MAIRFSVESRGVTRTWETRRSVVTFGRSKSSTVTIDDPALSRTHCQFESEGEACFVRDLASRNGTRIGEERVSRMELEPGDVVRIGQTAITFHGPTDAELVEPRASETAGWTARLFRSRAGERRVADGGAPGELQLRRLLRALERVAGELEPERVLTRVLDAAIEFLDAERGFLLLVEQAKLRVPVARDFWKKDIPTPAFELSRSIALEVVRRGEPLLTDDAVRDERFDAHASVHDLQLRSVLCVPLRLEGRTVGAVYLDNRFSRRTFAEADLDAMELFSEQAAQALARSETWETLRRESERLRDEAERRRRERDAMAARLRQLERDDGLRHDFGALVGRGEAMRRTLALADRVVDADLPVLIRGESGTGKELLARALHDGGPRRERPFVPLDCAGLSPSVAEAELFGSVRGAFTGSTGDRPGLFEAADGGTLFLDEIGDLDLELQKRLLRVLETGEIRRVGENRERRVNVRIVSATHRDLEARVASGAFREDLYYRLKGVRIDLPPLRERPEDLALLWSHFASRAGRDLPLTDAARRALQAHAWPGNVRELSNEVRRLAAVAGEGPVGVEDLAAPIRAGGGPPAGGLKAAVENLERGLLRSALERHGGNKTRAAEELGLSRLGLRKKMARYGIGDAAAAGAEPSPEDR